MINYLFFIVKLADKNVCKKKYNFECMNIVCFLDCPLNLDKFGIAVSS